MMSKFLCLYIEQQGFPLFTNYIAAYARLSLEFSDHTKKTQLQWREIDRLTLKYSDTYILVRLGLEP